MSRLLWGLAGLLLLAVAGFGGVMSLFGREALTAGANRGAWIFWFAARVVPPLSAVGFCVAKAVRPGRRAG
jgi:hypothetical protein